MVTSISNMLTIFIKLVEYKLKYEAIRGRFATFFSGVGGRGGHKDRTVFVYVQGKTRRYGCFPRTFQRNRPVLGI